MHPSKKLTTFSVFILIIATSLVYAGFLSNPLVFDDIPFFKSASQSTFQNTEYLFTRRWLPYATLEWSLTIFGQNLLWLRLGNLALHTATAISLFFFLRRLFDVTASNNEQHKITLSSHWLAFYAALIFALHPVSVYATGYLIQRSILMATFFTLLTWHCFLEGILRKNSLLLFTSALTFLLAVFSKEHAIMAPAVAIFILPLLQKKTALEWLKLLWPTFILYVLVALFIAMQSQSNQVIGQLYEPKAANLIASTKGLSTLAYPLSVLTQSFLFFKYWLLWIVPSPTAMSIDMRQPFAEQLFSFPYLLGLIGFVLYPIVAVKLLFKQGIRGLLGFAMLCPWLMFATELSTTRIQETFVLYRSYLWMPGAFAAIPFACQKLNPKQAALALIIVCFLITPVSILKLKTFSHPLLLWDDAARLVEHNQQNHLGTARIFYNRGNQYKLLKLFPEAIGDYNKVLQIADDSSYIIEPTYVNRGASFLESQQFEKALSDFNLALNINKKNTQAQLGKKLATEFIKKQDNLR